MSEEIKKIIEKVRTRGIVISRVPKKVKTAFMKIADDEFEGDYGMTLKFLFDSAMLNETLNNLNFKLNYLIEMIEKTQSPKEIETKSIKLLDGREIKIKKKEV